MKAANTLVSGATDALDFWRAVRADGDIASIAKLEIAPATAKLWLKSSKGNRNLSPRRVNEMARSMRAGMWSLNGKPIVFSRDGKTLRGGHHRLNACVLANCSFFSTIVFTDDDLHDESDKPWNIWEIMNAHEGVGVYKPSSQAAIMMGHQLLGKLGAKLERCTEPMFEHYTSVIGIEHLNAILDKNPRSHCQRHRRMQASIVAVLALARPLDIGAIDTLTDDVVGRVGSLKSPSLALGGIIESARTKGYGSKQEFRYELCLRACVAVQCAIKKRPVSILHASETARQWLIAQREAAGLRVDAYKVK